MKKIYFITALLFILVSSCKSKNIVIPSVLKKATTCIENDSCIVEVIPNKTIVFKADDFGNLYPVIEEGNNTIFKYTYQKKSSKNLQDSNYTEIVYAELTQPISEQKLTNNALSKVKLHFGRLCFCKGQTGYYPIQKGTFSIKKLDANTINISLKFSISEVPHVISTISETISLK